MSFYCGSYASNSDFLAHYGVRGMKWGVRKAIIQKNFQKPKSRAYNDATQKLASKSSLKRDALDKSKKASEAKKNLSFMGRHGFGKTAKDYRIARTQAAEATNRYYNSLSKKEYERLRRRHVG